MMKVQGVLGVALSAIMLLGAALSGVESLQVESEEAFFSELNSYVESLTNTSAVDMDSEPANGVTKDYETMALFFY